MFLQTGGLAYAFAVNEGVTTTFADNPNDLLFSAQSLQVTKVLSEYFFGALLAEVSQASPPCEHILLDR